MELLIVLVILGVPRVWAYTSGRLIGSRQGYGHILDHGRPKR